MDHRSETELHKREQMDKDASICKKLKKNIDRTELCRRGGTVKGATVMDHRSETELHKREQMDKDASICKKLKKNIDRTELRRRGGTVKVSLNGGQVISWQTNSGEELLLTPLKSPNPLLRGGIQVCFPQFGKDVTLEVEKHGLARNKIWEIDENPLLYPFQYPTDENDDFIDLLLKPTEEEMEDWKYRYELHLRVALADDGKLTLTARVRNMGNDFKPFVFGFAFNAYILVSAISEVHIEGMRSLDDNLKDRELCTESEVNRIVNLYDYQTGRSIHIQKNGLHDIQYIPVSNPGERTVCIGGFTDLPIILPTGMQWECRMTLQYVQI